MKTFFNEKLYKYNSLTKFLFFKKVQKSSYDKSFSVIIRNDKSDLNTLKPFFSNFDKKIKVNRKMTNLLKLPTYFINTNIYSSSSLHYFVSIDWKKLYENQSINSYVVCIMIFNKIYTLNFFINNILPILKCIYSNKFFLLTISARPWLVICKQIQHVLKSQKYIS